jgi:hypothetical protein
MHVQPTLSGQPLLQFALGDGRLTAAALRRRMAALEGLVL